MGLYIASVYDARPKPYCVLGRFIKILFSIWAGDTFTQEQRLLLLEGELDQITPWKLTFRSTYTMLGSNSVSFQISLVSILSFSLLMFR